MRLIDADALEKRLDNEKWMDNFDRDFIVDVALDEAPTVDAVQVAPVKIERYNDGQGRCPLCKTDIPFRVVNDKWEFELYCPHCGAKMDLEDDAK